MKSVHSGYYHFFAMSNEDQPKIYGWGRNNYNQIGMNSQNSKVHTPTLAEGIENLTIHQVYPARLCSFFLNRETNTLYGSGSNSNGNLGVENPLKLTTVCKLHENVTKVFTGHADHSFIIKTDGKLYGFGSNYHGELGNDRLCAQRTPLEIKLEFPLCKIKKIIISFQFSAILTTDGRLFVSGLARSIGFDTDLTKFTQYPQFQNKKNFITDAASGDGFISFITRDKEVWVGDLGKLLSNGYFSDCKIKNITVYKILIETRIGKSFDLIRNYLEENYQSKEIEDLLMWVYCDEMRNSKRMKEILNHFGIENPQETKLLKNDLKKLLFDEETSDFKLVVKIEDGDDDEEELHIHKFILTARCDTDQEFVKEEFEDIVEYYQLNPQIPILEIFVKCSNKAVF
ncbi:regulator of chromosome condensation [Anaeramoeba flamelloides]|uniref:Regulator of chromosome condensation n=1 Tax=Anaeramoeba flamelloides TaxID=1746091 RepID=A0AAV7ZPJ8_9EUKA|nr:regulator of chromosome condensation [Anaeramoeba flamelloides]